VLARSIGRCLGRIGGGDAAAAHPAEPPPRLYVFCNQGMNRSGLMIGLILRALGLAGEDALRAITCCRPGALTNRTFVRLLHEGDGST
jgi:protein-tyrosine phosphatase